MPVRTAGSDCNWLGLPVSKRRQRHRITSQWSRYVPVYRKMFSATAFRGAGAAVTIALWRSRKWRMSPGAKRAGDRWLASNTPQRSKTFNGHSTDGDAGEPTRSATKALSPTGSPEFPAGISMGAYSGTGWEAETIVRHGRGPARQSVVSVPSRCSYPDEPEYGQCPDVTGLQSSKDVVSVQPQVQQQNACLLPEKTPASASRVAIAPPKASRCQLVGMS